MMAAITEGAAKTRILLALILDYIHTPPQQEGLFQFLPVPANQLLLDAFGRALGSVSS